jgi:hyperosmotically inducible periplasmic protein
MKTLVVLIVGILIGAGAIWVYTTKDGQSASKNAGDQVESAAKSTRDAIQEKIRTLDLKPDQIKEDLDRTGKVIRRKAREAGDALADATADARITGAIKGKLLANKDLSAVGISVNTTAGVVTLSGSVNSTEDIGKAIMLAMDTDGVREVISTLQVKK